jgi:hypothetical protein
MTPKEKALELYGKFFYAIPNDEMGRNHDAAKQCALIAVDEILLIANDYFFHDEDEIKTKAYWIEVKQEIEAL